MERHIRRISPQAAWELLERNKCERERDPYQVAAYALRMRLGSWLEPTDEFILVDTGTSEEPVKLNPDGELLDGQHRLHAVILSGMAIKFTFSICENTP